MNPELAELLEKLPPERREDGWTALAPFSSDPNALSIVLHLLEGLNPEQLEVAIHPPNGSPVLVLGGAGSGKTATLTRRLVFLVLSGVPIEGIFAVTFTRKAAREMADRTMKIIEMLRDRSQPPYRTWLEEAAMRIREAWITTFHSAGLRLLRESPFEGESNLQAMGYATFSRVLDEHERNMLLSKLVREYCGDEFRCEQIGGIISNAKGSFVYPEAFHHMVQSRQDEVAAMVYPRYKALLESRGLLDFDDLIFMMYELFERRPDILAHYQERFNSLLIDEYQDTNMSQYLIGMMLAKQHRRIMVVGDDDQAIYSWRGAEVNNITRFISDYPDIRIVKLVRNYRSDATILDAANAIWADKPAELRKTLLCAKATGEDAEPVRMVSVESDAAEGRFIANQAYQFLDEGIPAREIAVLVRSHYLLAPVVQALEEIGIPWVQAGAIKSLARPEVLGTVAVMEVAALVARRVSTAGEWQAGDEESLTHAVKQAATGPAYACDPSVTGELDLLGSVAEALIDDTRRKAVLPGLDGRLGYALDHLAAFARAAMYDPGCWRPSTMLERVLQVAPPFTSHDDSDPGRLAINRMRELALIADYRRVRSPVDAILVFTEEVRGRAGMLQDEGESVESAAGRPEAVQLMTLHAAKGLEFEVVFLASMEDGIIPVRRREDDSTTAEAMAARLAEERRLFYVGVSRAKRRLFISRSRLRNFTSGEREMRPSPFLAYIPESLVERIEL